MTLISDRETGSKPEGSLTFIIRSDLNVPTPAIPMPDFAVP